MVHDPGVHSPVLHCGVRASDRTEVLGKRGGPADTAGTKAACLEFLGAEKMRMEVFETEYIVAMKSERSAARRFKFALILLVEAVLFSKEPRNYIHGWVVNMVSDTEAFLRYPWGRLCYERTHDFLYRCVERKLQHGVSSSRPSYLLAGFPLAFQVWT